MSFQSLSESYNDAFILNEGEGMSCQWGMVSHFTLSVVEVTPKLVGEAFYNGEVESELRRIHRIDYCFKKDEDRDNYVYGYDRRK